MSSRSKRKSRKTGRPILIITGSPLQSISTIHATTALKVALVEEAAREGVSLSYYVAGVLAGIDPRQRLVSFRAAREAEAAAAIEDSAELQAANG